MKTSQFCPCALGILLCCLAGFHSALACGPFFYEVGLSDQGIVDIAPRQLRKGDLGVIRPGLAWQDLVLIYRGLRGLPVEAEPQSGRAPSGRAPVKGALPDWLDVRGQLQGIPAPPKIAEGYETASYVWVRRISAHARQTAARTLDRLLQAHGPNDPAVRDWVLAQDQVFASAPGKPLIPPEVNDPPWLVEERQYQIAAARFYANLWAEARADFLRIAEDAASPWRPWGRYLAARCLIREAQLVNPELPADRMRQLYREAGSLLESLLRDPSCVEVHGPAEELLELARYRFEPEVLLVEFLLEEEREQPRWPEAQANEKIQDAFDFVRRAGREAGVVAGSESADNLMAASDLGLWIGALARQVPWKTDAGAALRRWETLRTPLWLIAALATAEPADRGLDALKAAAREADGDPRLGPTIRWHLLRLEIGALEGVALATRLDRALKEERDLPPWAVNELRSRRQAGAADTATWLALASRKIVTLNGFDGQGPFLPSEAPGSPPAEVFDFETAKALTQGLPLARIPSLLGDSRIPIPAREEIAKAAWTRAVLLDAWGSARKLSPLLHPELRKAAGEALQGSNPLDLKFRALLLFLDWPGLRPQVDVGFGRQYASVQGDKHRASLGQFDVLRDNWWCSLRERESRERENRQSGVAGRVTTTQIPGLTPEERSAAEAEWNRILQVPGAQTWFGTVALAYAAAHPKDPRVPRALSGFVRSTRSPQCPDKEMSALGKRAFTLLHKRYPDSEWAGKTPYWF